MREGRQVVLDLLLQSVQRAELTLLANETQKIERELLTIQIAMEIRDMHLYCAFRIADGRVGSYIAESGDYGGWVIGGLGMPNPGPSLKGREAGGDEHLIYA